MNKNENRQKRIRRVRAKITGTSSRPRFCVFRSLNFVYAQLIDDENGKVIVSADSRNFSATAGSASGGKNAKKNVEIAEKIGNEIAKMALEKNIKSAVFDKRGYKYHGKVKAIAEGARKGGLKF